MKIIYQLKFSHSIYRATRFGKLSIVDTLLERGASVNVRNKFGSTPLHLACEYGHHDIVKVGESGHQDIMQPISWLTIPTNR